MDLLNSINSNKNSIKANPKEQVDKAKSNLQKAKEVESNKTDHVWITKEKTSKFIHKDKLQELLLDGWKINQIANG